MICCYTVQRRFSALCGNGQLKGDTLFQKRVSPFKSPERNFTLAVCSSKSCTRCAIRCGVHGFAMNPCDSTHPATAPYYREARVTVERRQTACGMRLCCARRIDETGGRRKLGCTSTRLAERQRIIEAETNRIATLTAAAPHAGISIPEASRSFKIETANQSPFSWGV